MIAHLASLTRANICSRSQAISNEKDHGTTQPARLNVQEHVITHRCQLKPHHTTASGLKNTRTRDGVPASLNIQEQMITQAACLNAREHVITRPC